ncbi:alpha/beta hydrolase [Microbacterium sp. CSI-V]|uniref:alpha/beta fold hydrolase n=1 Tax=unclassified Microbacterium TaxID=2609290 RepID=UPI00097C871C|nr:MULTISPECIES: alpha/beta hydrolase [unclassified Microbacterium]MXS75124.1 alpha/beta hydrolase [Microbacterium sp. TL13]ONI65933.1 alpha/beta hydrolase [Microbacterium sp. CSI-V]
MERQLRRLVVPTAVGPVVAHAGRRSTGTVATVLLHGAAGSWRTWIPLLSAADRLGIPLDDVIAIDLPGWGESPGPMPDPAAAAEAVVAVARALGYPRWRVVGHSLGAVVALDVAARFPAQTVAVGLVSPTGAGVRAVVGRPATGWLTLPAFGGMVAAMAILRSLGPLARPLLHGLRRIGALRVFARPLFRHPDRVDPAVSDALADEIRPAAFLDAARAARTHDDEAWKRITAPVRAVRGRHDVFAGRQDARDARRRIPGYRETVLEDSGHFAHVEQAYETLRALRDVWTAEPDRRSPSKRDRQPT